MVRGRDFGLEIYSLISRFYFADERKADGAPGGMGIDGDAHADFYAQLAEHAEGVSWHATFVKGKGYVKFT